MTATEQRIVRTLSICLAGALIITITIAGRYLLLSLILVMFVMVRQNRKEPKGDTFKPDPPPNPDPPGNVYKFYFPRVIYPKEEGFENSQDSSSPASDIRK